MTWVGGGDAAGPSTPGSAYHQSGRLTRHARRRHLRLDTTWPWSDAFVLAWQRLTQLTADT
ncbi:hypothetical protein [Streptomyces sp. KS 21]|uniref:hypothetical protein n=1 Tax=Streptomyces sp. KS 21 TaxID=2485150 RepID=UPI001062E451|nr:hypothetical protein [Streptomyces sp. KS 21]